jgi:cytosine permease
MVMSSESENWRDEIGDFALVPVPGDEKRSMLNVFLVYSGVLAVFAFIATGTAVGLRYDVRGMIVVSVVASIILMVIGSGIAYIGGLTSLSTYITMRYPFGYVGSWLWGTVVSGIPGGLGWFAFETWLFGVTVNTIAPNAFWADVGVAAIWGGVLMMLTAYYGYGGLSVLSYLAVPLFFLIAIAGIMVGLEQTANIAELLALTPQNPAQGINVGVTTVVGSYVVGASITMDIGRFAPKAWHAAAAWGVQILLFMPIVVAGAGIMTLTTGETDFASVMLSAGMGLGVFLMAVFGFWSTNDNNLYVGALAWSLFVPLKKKHIVIVQGIIGTAIAAWVGFSAGASMDPFVAFLGLLGTFIPGVAGVILGDFYIYRWLSGKNRHERYAYKPGKEYGLIVWPGWVAAILGSYLGGWVLTSGITSLNVLVLAGVLHVVLMYGCDVANLPQELGSTAIDETGQSPEIHGRIPGATKAERAD